MTPTEFQSWFMGLCEGMGEGTTPNLHQWKEVKNRIQLMDTDKEMSAPKVSGADALKDGNNLAHSARSPEKKPSVPTNKQYTDGSVKGDSETVAKLDPH